MRRLGAWTQHGVALPEFLVASACTLVVFGAVLGACCILGRALQFQDAAATRRAEVMVGLGALRDAVEWAGSLGSEDGAAGESSFPRQTSGWPARLVFSAGQTIAGGAQRAGAASRDFVAVRGFAPAGGVYRDCPGKVGVRDEEPSPMRLSVYTVGDGRLFWQSKVADRKSTVALAAATGLRVRYGVDLNRDDAVEQYLDAAQVDAAEAWDAVRSVEITLDLAHAPQASACRLRQVVALRARL